MNQQEAEKLLIDTFNGEFDSDKFVHFLKELLKGKLSINPKSSSPHKEFEEYIKSFKKIGEYKNGRNNIEVLIVELKKTSSLERARTMQRNFIAKWLNSDYSPKDGALVAFYEENLEDWRFSFVKMDYKFGDDGKVIKELTPAKRYSFLVGKNEPNHTCKKQFLNLLKEETISPTLEELEKAFSVDNVTKEFFDQYKERFIQLKESVDEIIKKNSIVRKEFEVKGINTIEFSKKLLGQIVFLYFLQKKGWLGVQKDSGGKFNEWGSGPKDFMKKLFNKEIVPYDNFFNDVLEPLFYQALANDRSADNDYYEKLKCKVPFLNGGLFEPIKDYEWTNTDILIDNNIFKDIFTTFDQFNFTIKEDEPLEREVAVDPEMLGKVFENLLDVNDRKSKGAFYTPREIVHYMCQQSLINYLETNTLELSIKRDDIELFILKGDIALDRLRRIQLGKWDDARLVLPKSIVNNYKELDKLLKEIKICDPAVGSGAFPVGMMNEIVRTRNILTYFFPEKDKKERTDYFLKRQTIENSLYGVDIESSAVEITKLRFWLSLIVDELDMRNIRPLPNLDNRIMCGNSLIEEFEGVKLFDESLANGKTSKQMTLFKKGSEYKLETLQKLQSTYFNEQDRNKKKRLMKDIENLEWEFIEATLKEQGNEEAMKKLEQYKNSKSKPFFLWKLYFSDVFQRDNPGFDVVIGNPPYVGVKGHSDLFEPIRNGTMKQFYSGRGELFYFFFHLSLNLGRDKSSVAFITTNYYPTASYGNLLRKDFKERAEIVSLINFNELRIFESALGQHNLITILRKSNERNLVAKNIITKKKGIADPTILSAILNHQDKDTDYFNIAQNELYDGKENYIRLGGTSGENNQINKILGKLSINPLLGDICFVRQGLRTGIDKTTQSHKLNYNLKGEMGEGVFIITKKELSDIKLNINEKKIIKEFYKNSDISKFYTKQDSDQYVFYIAKTYDEKKLKKDCPNIYAHLLKFKELILKIRGRNNEQLDHWVNLDRTREEFIFTSQKIVAPQRSYKNTFGFSEKEWYASADVYYILQNNKKYLLKYILALINSKLYYLWLYTRGKRKGDMLELYQNPLSEIPIKDIPEKQQKPFIELVDRILSITNDKDYLKNQDKQARVKAYGNRIDKMVYELYELTPEEINIVEDFGK